MKHNTDHVQYILNFHQPWLICMMYNNTSASSCKMLIFNMILSGPPGAKGEKGKI